MEFNCYLTYIGKRSYKSKTSGNEVTLYKFQGNNGRYIECKLSAEPEKEGAVYNCTMRYSHRWLENEKRYDNSLYIVSAQPAKLSSIK